MEILSGTFDTTNALSSVYLWIIFGYLSSLLNCDLQRFIRQNPLFTHVMGLMAVFFLFTLLDSNNQTTIQLIALKTVFVYAMFIFMTKSKWYFVLPVLTILLVDQGMKKQLTLKMKAQQQQSADVDAEDAEDAAQKAQDAQDAQKKQAEITRILNIIIIVLIVIGTLHYMYLQYNEYGDKFSFYTFFLGTNTRCKSVAGLRPRATQKGGYL
jgi:hypothetical protein